jgi:hypothetical protein
MVRRGWERFIAVWAVIAVAALAVVAVDILSWFNPTSSPSTFGRLAPVAAGVAIGATLMSIFGFAKRRGE